MRWVMTLEERLENIEAMLVARDSVFAVGLFRLGQNLVARIGVYRIIVVGTGGFLHGDD